MTFNVEVVSPIFGRLVEGLITSDQGDFFFCTTGCVQSTLSVGCSTAARFFSCAGGTNRFDLERLDCKTVILVRIENLVAYMVPITVAAKGAAAGNRSSCGKLTETNNNGNAMFPLKN